MQIERCSALSFHPGLTYITVLLLLPSLVCSQLMFPLHTEIGIRSDSVSSVCVELLTVNAGTKRDAEALPLEIWQLRSCLFILSLLSGSLQQGLEYIKNLWVLPSRQLWGVFLQPIRRVDLVPESANQRVQAVCGL